MLFRYPPVPPFVGPPGRRGAYATFLTADAHQQVLHQ